tara:strand:+ start:187 stop:399 length:213 start_codon:yes stop_codon:yes gene_type:complete
MTLIWSAVVTATLINALFYLSNMTKTKLLPFKIKFEFIPMFGFLVGIPPKRPWEILIVVPFCTIEVSKRN